MWPRIRHPQAKPRAGRHHKKGVDIPPNGTLVQPEKNFIWDAYGVMCAVRLRKGSGKRQMSMRGNSTNFAIARDWALFMMRENIRIDVCKCMGCQSEQIRINKK